MGCSGVRWGAVGWGVAGVQWGGRGVVWYGVVWCGVVWCGVVHADRQADAAVPCVVCCLMCGACRQAELRCEVCALRRRQQELCQDTDKARQTVYHLTGSWV